MGRERQAAWREDEVVGDVARGIDVFLDEGG
jgi:hypothetical protein